jgi:hypothetical protein
MPPCARSRRFAENQFSRIPYPLRCGRGSPVRLEPDAPRAASHHRSILWRTTGWHGLHCFHRGRIDSVHCSRSDRFWIPSRLVEWIPVVDTFFEHFGGTPGRSRTCDISFRKAALYPSELRGRHRNRKQPAPKKTHQYILATNEGLGHVTFPLLCTDPLSSPPRTTPSAGLRWR